MRDIAAFIFDMDDTLIESEALNVRLIGDYFKAVWKLRLDEQDAAFVYGHSWQDIYNHLIKKYELASTINDIQLGVMGFKQTYLQCHRLNVASGLLPVLALPPRKVIVSGSGKQEIEIMLSNAGLAHHFETTFSVDEYEKGKPDPAGFVMALNYLGLRPEQALVFEDSRSGLQSARNAGVRSVFLREFADQDHSAHADLTFVDFQQFYEYYCALAV